MYGFCIVGVIFKERDGVMICFAFANGNAFKETPFLMKELNSPFRLTSLIYAERFEFENSAIMEDKQCKQTERFSWQKEAIFLSLDDKSKQRHKVKINSI